MSEKLIITKKDDLVLSSVFEKEDLIRINAENIKSERILGNIYLGKVKNIIKNINAAFVEIKDGRMCYLPLEKEINPIFANPKKNNKITVGDTIVIQIMKENIKNKAPNASCHFGFTGKYIVLTHGNTKMGISVHITSIQERERLKSILEEYVNDSFGLIIRTNGENISKEQLHAEINRLKALYENILEFGIHKTRFSCIYQAPNSYITDIRDGRSNTLEEIITDDKEIYEEVRDYLNCYQLEDLEKLRFFPKEPISLNRIYNIETRLSKALSKQVWLKSGGSIVIEPTEALTVIDVNTGKAIKGKRKIQETFKRVNLEAAYEIAKQIPLRNLSGIIIVDFIDLESDEDKEELLFLLKSLLSKDPVKTVVIDMTPLGLIEITRKKIRKPLHEQFKKEKNILT